jgi:EAL domain-containing protein (putative c-di-GMP-specific phosphodiesterase class I)
MNNKNFEKTLQKVVKELFEYFLIDPYLSRKIPTYLDTIVLIKRIVQRLKKDFIPAVKEKDEKKLFRFCYRIGLNHKKLQISEMMFFKSIDFFRERLEENRIELDLTENEIAFWIKNCKKGAALAYIESFIKDTLQAFENGNIYRKYFYEVLKVLKKTIKRIKENTEINREELNVAFPKCPICEILSSVDFFIKTYTNFNQRLRLEAEHKDFHQFLANFYEHLLVGKYEGAAFILRELIVKIYSLDTILKEIELFWKLKKEINFLGFLTDEYYSHGLLIILIPRSENELVRKRLIKDFLRTFYQNLNNLRDYQWNKYIFILDLDGGIYLYIDHEAEHFDEILNTFFKSVQKANQFGTLYLVEGKVPTYSVGYIDTNYFHKMDIEVLNEFLKEAERYIQENTLQAKEELPVFYLNTVFEDLFIRANDNLEKKKLIKKSLKLRKISLFYQPIVDLFTQETFGIEILARLFSPQEVYIPAGKFIEFVKQEGLTLDLDRAVLKTTIGSLKTLKKLSQNLFINLFPNSLSDKEVVSLILELLHRMEEENMNLYLELTEHTVVTNKDILEQIEKGNLFIVFDDFGSGYTNFKTVARLAEFKRTSILKIDGELVKGITSNTVDEKVVESITAFAKNLNFQLVYEYISTREVYEKVKEILKKVGLNRAYGQGYYFSHPLPAVVNPPVAL